MLPISFRQTKFINPLNFVKSFIWFLFRRIQLKNTKKYKKIFLYDFSKSEVSSLSIPLHIQFVEKADKDTLILIKKFNFLLIFKFVFQLKNIRILDKNFFLSSEASTRLRLRYYDFSSLNERENFINLSNQNFERLKNLSNFDSVAVLGTGPSYEKARDIFLNRNIEIVTCNSAIYDDELWNQKCRIICFADPVFHFGESEEAFRFKSKVKERFNNQKFYIICPVVAFPILIDDWKIDENYIIGFQPIYKNYKIGKDTQLLSPNTSNVLTEFMLPFSVLISKNIYFGGFDGRGNNEKNFWKYSKKTQQTLDEHIENHPSFFVDRNIDKYYKSHINILNNQVLELESLGFEIYNVTDSNIDILNERYLSE
tara:strand:+ start:1879 stop:2985 length:1107 start_codon:yes stop_codon:yes gene_type:complete